MFEEGPDGILLLANWNRAHTFNLLTNFRHSGYKVVHPGDDRR